MREYKDRGIIKWAPFDALISYQDILNVMRYERGKKDKPILLEDQCETLNRIIKIAMIEHMPLYVTYYEDGYFKTLYGIIKRYNQIHGTLIFEEGFHIKIDQILDAND